jgi:uncharacterized protein (TIGR02217 family)
MAFINLEFPACLAMGAVGTPEWRTAIAENQGGYEQRNQVWSYSKHSYDVSTAVKARSDYYLALEHFNEVRGRLNSFPFKDFLDFEVTEDNGALVYVSPGIFQLGKRYGSVNPYLRKITRPIVGSVLRDGSPVTAGAGAGQYTLGALGLITFQPDQTRTISAHTVGATHQFDLASAFSPNVAPGSVIYVSGVTGSAAALLNAVPLTVTAVAADLVNVNVNTTGLTASGGTAAWRVAAGELSWEGEFRVPVRYGMDRLPGQVVNSNGRELFVQATSITLMEVRDV